MSDRTSRRRRAELGASRTRAADARSRDIELLQAVSFHPPEIRQNLDPVNPLRNSGKRRALVRHTAVEVTPLFSLRENAIAKEPGLSYPERWRCVF